MLHPESVVQGREYYRLLTSDLVHNDFGHLVLNEIMLFTYCVNLEAFLNDNHTNGSLLFLGIYLVSCLSGAVVTTLFHKWDEGYSSAGASGSIIGCLFSYTILSPNITAFYLPALGGVKNLYFGIICLAVFIIYQKRTKNTMLNHEVHFFGAVGGILTTLILIPHIIK